MDTKELFKLFRKSGEVNFIKFLDSLGDHNVKKTSNTDRPERQDNRQSNRRQEQIIQRSKKIRRNNKELESSKKTFEIKSKVLRGEI